VRLLELVAVLLAQRHDRRHVHFVERGQDGVFVLRLQQALGDAGTQAGHRHALLGTVGTLHRGGGGGSADEPRGRSSLGRAAEHLGWAATASSLVTRPPRPDRRRRRRRCPSRRGSCARPGWRPPTAASGRRSGGGAAAGSGRSGRRLRHRAALASVSIRAISSPETTVSPPCLMIFDQHAVGRRRGSSTTLSVSMSIRFSSRETASPSFLCQVTSVAFGDGLGQLRNFDFDHHVLSWILFSAANCGGVLDLAETRFRSAPFVARCAWRSSRPPAKRRCRTRHQQQTRCLPC
jgi:hypothetical protein